MLERLNPSEVLLPSSSKHLAAVKILLQELESVSASHEDAIELPSQALENGVPRYSRNSIALSNKPSENGGVTYHVAVFCAASLGAIVFWFSAADAIKRYPFGSYAFFEWNAPISSILTNTFFNEMAYLDYLNDDYQVSIVSRIMAIVAAIATIAPYFIVGFVGALWQKILVSISVLFDFPVFYYGALDFYQYFHADFVQQWRWFLRCSAENFTLASQKAHLVSQIKNQYNDFVYATKDERALFISDFQRCEIKAQLAFLVNKNQAQKVELNNGWLAWLRWLLCSGSGLWGIAVMAQNIGHALVVIMGVLMIQQIPFWAQIFLLIFLVPGSLLPNFGYSFATMADFDFLDFLSITFFLKVPQAQRVIAGDSIITSISTAFILILLRYIYITSGWSNDQVNYQGALYVGANAAEAECAGINGNLTIALVYNGVLCEKLFKTIMIWIAEKIGGSEDKQQLEFEKFYSKIVKKIIILPLAEVREMESNPKFSLTYANYFSTQEKKSKSCFGSFQLSSNK